MSDNPLSLRKVHHVEFWVGNAKQAAFYYQNALGFDQVGYLGLETGHRDRASYALQQGQARFVVSSQYTSHGPIAEHVKRHGDGVKDVAFLVDDVDRAFGEAVRRGAKVAAEPFTIQDDFGRVRRAAIQTYGDTIHSFIATNDYKGPFLPGYQPRDVKGHGTGILYVDHIVGNVELGHMERWCDFYEKVLGFQRYLSFDDETISTEYSSLMSVVMSDDKQVIKFPINEPALGRRKSQIEEYLDFYEGPGVQHVALATNDVCHTVAELRRRGVDFLNVPDSYYDGIWQHVGAIKEEQKRVKDLGILVDRDQDGYLLQLFTKPVQDRPTVFFEFIQRAGSRGFGAGNFKALFEAIEREQAVRGNL
jgi:4-hydroxyphenylpyruvate dioxygenase